jgi:ribosomal protein S6--L-glutamate ligase
MSTAPLPVLAPPPYTPAQWDNRRGFVAAISSICDSHGISLTWFSDYWIAQIEHGGSKRFIVGDNFPVNNPGATAIAKDKVATYQVLDAAGITAVPHWAVSFPSSVPSQPALASIADAALGYTNLPMVIKPCTEAGGRDVFLINDRPSLTKHLQILAAHHYVAAVSPFIDQAREFRVLMKQTKPRIIYEKLRPDQREHTSDWRHNLGLGASPAPVTDQPLRASLQQLAAATMTELDLTLAAIDIIQGDNGLQVLEINTSLSLNQLSKHRAFMTAAFDLYAEAIQLSLA